MWDLSQKVTTSFLLLVSSCHWKICLAFNACNAKGIASNSQKVLTCALQLAFFILCQTFALGGPVIGHVRVEHPTSTETLFLSCGELGERSLDPPDANRAAMDQNGKMQAGRLEGLFCWTGCYWGMQIQMVWKLHSISMFSCSFVHCFFLKLLFLRCVFLWDPFVFFSLSCCGIRGQGFVCKAHCTWAHRRQIWIALSTRQKFWMYRSKSAQSTKLEVYNIFCTNVKSL